MANQHTPLQYTIEYGWLYGQYVLKQRAIYDIANEIGCSHSVICNRLKKFNIPTRPRCDATPDTRRLMSESRRGKPSGMAGKVQSDDARRKMSESRKGKRLSPEIIAKVAASNTGKKRSIETRTRMSIARKGKTHKGTSPSKEVRAKLSEAFSGSRSPNWQGGISFEPYCPKFNQDLRRRVRAFFEHRCVCCGKHATECFKNLSVHHVAYDKQICCNGKPVCFAALCHRCHSRTNHDRERWESMLHRIIDEIWQGRSYFTKDEWARLDYV